MAKGDEEWVLTATELRRRLGHPPTDEEVQLELDIKLLDSAGGKIIESKPKKGKHRK